MDNLDRSLHSGERVIFDKSNINLARHLAVYEFAKRFTTNKLVLDTGCGTGYGSPLISGGAKQVIGIDISDESIVYAREHFKNNNLTFLCMDTVNLQHFDKASFEIMFSIMVIEHIADYRNYLKETRRLAPHFICVCRC